MGYKVAEAAGWGRDGRWRRLRERQSLSVGPQQSFGVSRPSQSPQPYFIFTPLKGHHSRAACLGRTDFGLCIC